MTNRNPTFIPPFSVSNPVRSMAEPFSWANEMLSNLLEELEGFGGKTHIVGDTGIDRTHPALKNKVIAAKDFTGKRPDVLAPPIHVHGTAVAGLIVGNSSTFQGMDPKGKVIDATMLYPSGHSGMIEDGFSMFEQYPEAWGINLSLGMQGWDQSLAKTTNYWLDKGKYVFVAAGNSALSGVSFPGTLERAITVAAVDKNKDWAKFSSVGARVDFAAPGKDVPTITLNKGYGAFSGTSFSSPIVAALSGRICDWRECKGQDELFYFLKEHAIDLDTPGFDNKTGWGLINVNFPIVKPTPDNCAERTLMQKLLEWINTV